MKTLRNFGNRLSNGIASYPRKKKSSQQKLRIYSCTVIHFYGADLLFYYWV